MLSSLKQQAEKWERKTNDLSRRLITITDPEGGPSEAYRILCTNLLYGGRVEQTTPKVILVTSPGPGDGRSTVCANLAVVLAQASKHVLLVDCDFRKPAVHAMFGLRNVAGIVDVLNGTHHIQEVSQEPLPKLKLLPVGSRPFNPTEIVVSQRFTEFLAQVRQEFEYVLVDAPPVGIASDALILAARVDAVLLVLDVQKTRKQAVRQAARSLEAVGANLVGTVMNNVEAAAAGNHQYRRLG